MAGKVYLVGAGPGDYKLLTLKAMECLKEADVIVYDRLANEDYLKLGKEGCKYINVGKASSNHTMPQDEINEVLAKWAQEGKVVTRLKGGDPYVFGRGGEEGEYLFERNIPFEVVPGITSAIGGLCYAGIPITHRDCASSFHVITGHLREDGGSRKGKWAEASEIEAGSENKARQNGNGEGINFKALAQLEGTLVFLMGIGNLEKITKCLMEAGKSPQTPVALISWATRYNQSVITGTLENIYETAMREGVKPPTLIVVGEVVHLRDRLNFFEQKPLFGKRVVVTRTREQSSQLVELIRDRGGNALEFPTIAIQKNADSREMKAALHKLKEYTYLVFTSPNAVEVFFEALEKENKDARALAHLKIAVIGQGTKKALKQKGITADLMPEKAVAECMAELMEKELTPSDYVLLPHSAIARDILGNAMAKICRVDEITAYETKPVPEEDEASERRPGELNASELMGLIERGEMDYITFTSSSTVHHFMERIGREQAEKLKSVKLISIGEVTTASLKEYGLTPAAQAAKPTMKEMADCMCGLK